MMSRRSMIAGSVGTIFAAAAVAIPAKCSGHVYPGTRINGIDISGMSPHASKALLQTRFKAFEEHAITYSFEGRSWNASLADLGMAVDYDSMIEQAMNHGRDGNLIDRYGTLLAEATELDIPLTLRRNDDVLASYLERLGGAIALDGEDARLEQRNSEIVVVEHAIGQRLDVEAARTETHRAVGAGETATIALTAFPVAPDVTAADLADARQEAALLVSAPILFSLGDSVFPVDVETLSAALVIGQKNVPRLAFEELKPRLDEIANAVFVPARNVKLGWNNGLYVVEDDVDGRSIDREGMQAAVADLTRSSERIAALPVTTIKAGARVDNIAELGIEGHLTYGSSSFVGSSDARAANVSVSAENISYKLVAPGERFSFNDLLGPITVENGFVEGKIIQGNWEASDIGGGVCQVSTTVFRAAAYAGFQFVEWHPHSWRLAFYEADGSPPGLDGAIYQPNTPDQIEKDLVFENPLDSWLLLMMVIDGGTVYAHFYGKDNGWNVELFEPRLSEPKPIPEPVERVNPSLAPGERVRVQNARAGVTARIRRKVTAADGSIISDGDFVSDYRSVPEAWEVGSS